MFNKIKKLITNLRIIKNLRNYSRTSKLMKLDSGQLSKNTPEGKALFDFIKSIKIESILEIGTWNGMGSTMTIVKALEESSQNPNFISIETDKIAYKNAVKNHRYSNPKVHIRLGRIIEVNELPKLEEIDFESFGFVPENQEWYIQDLRRYKKTKNILNELPKNFDFILFDGGEFCTFSEFKKLWHKTTYFALDDTKTYKQFEVLKFINQNNNNFQLITELQNFSIYKVLS